jgi:hypothetical protein
LDALLDSAYNSQEVKRLFIADNTPNRVLLQVHVPLELVCEASMALFLLLLASLYPYQQ